MEAEKNNFLNKTRHAQEQFDLAAYRKRYNRLLLAFKLFFISLTLITVAIITYLVQSESLVDESINRSVQIYSPIVTTESETFNLSLQSAAEELDRAASLIPTAAGHEAKTKLAVCRQRLQIGSLHLREAIRANPFPTRPSEKQRLQMANRIVAAEESMNSCLDVLAAADEVRAAVIGAAEYLRARGDFLMSYRRKMLRQLWKTVAALILENIIVICIWGLQLLFIFFLFWTIIKSR